MNRRKWATIVLSVLMVLLNLWPAGTARAAYLSDPKDLGNLSKGQAITRNDPEKGTETVKFDAYWTIIVDGQTVGEDLTITEPGKTAGNTNYIARSQAQQWVDVFNGSWNYAEDAAPWVTLAANGRTSTRVHIRPLAKVSGAYVEKYDYTQKKVWVLTTPWPSGNIPDLRGVVAGQPQTFWVEAYASTAEQQGIKNYTFSIGGTPIKTGKSSSNYAGFYVSHTFPSAGSYTMRLEVTDMVGRTTPITKTVSVAPAPQPPPPPPAPPPAGQPVADFDLPPFGEVGQNVQVVNRSRASEGFWLVHSEWTVTPRTYTGTLALAGGTLVFNRPGTYTVKLQVWDNQNNTSTATKSISISESAPPPPPPPPPQPENIPPVARFDMVAQASPGVSVPVRNRSYDPDGQTVRVEWETPPEAAANLDNQGGSIAFPEPGTYRVTLTVEDDRGASDSVTQTIRITNEPPVARISAPNTVFQGDEVEITSNSYDPDGEIAGYAWSVSPVGMMGTLTGEGGSVYFDEPGTYTVRLTVEDRFGRSDTATKTIEVKPAVPTAFFRWSGVPKQNRKLVFDASESYGSARYPVDFSQNRWEFLPPAGVSLDAVKTVSSPDLKTRQVLFKEPGDYRVRLVVENTKGTPSPVYEQVVTVYPDDQPVADFYTIRTVSRDPDNNNRAAIALMDRSHSPDGDVIAKRVWQYRYDSDNDGSFADESWATLDGGNNPTPTLYTNQVGKYEFSLYVEESFGQETIPEFITPADKRAADTSTKPLAERTVEVINLQPIVNFDALKKKKVDIVFTVGEVDPAKIQNLPARITEQIETKLAAMNIDYGTIQSVETSTVSTRDAGAEEIFNNWQKYPLISASMFDAGWRLYGNEIYTTANVHWTGFWDNRKQNATDQTIEFEVMTTQHPDPWGFTFRMTSPEPNRYSFYALEWGPYWQELTLAKITSWKPSSSDPTHGGPLYHGTISAADGYYAGSYHGGFAGALRDVSGKVLVRVPFNVQYNRWDHAKIDVHGNHIQIWVNGAKVIDYVDNDNPLLVGSYGPYTASQYNTHFRNVTITTGTRKTLDEVLKEPSWREDAQKFLVNISDVPYPEFDNPEKAAVIYSRLLSNGIYFNVLGTATNQAQAQGIITRNDGRGTYIDNGNMDSALAQLADYIIAQVTAQPRLIEKYVLLDEEVEYQTYYGDPESDPKFAERWIYQHDPYWFKNSLGAASYDGQYLPAPVTRFDKVGKFDVEFQARDNPKPDDRFDSYRLWSAMPQDKLTLYVHRKPLALFSVQMAPVGGGTANIRTEEDFEDASYAFSFTGNWSRSAQQKYGGNYSYRSASIGDGGSTASQFTVNVPPGATNGSLSLYHLVRSESGYDFLNIYLDGNRVVRRSGYGNWQQYKTPLSPGNHTVKFEYTKDGSVSDYDDAAYVDNILLSYDAPAAASYSVQLTSQSYDLDHQGEAGQGIVQEEWRWKEALEAGWHPGKPAELDPGETYLVSLRVKDVEGAWSDENVKVLSTGSLNMPPVAQFSVSPNPLPLGKDLSYNDLSYDPNGDTITERKWRMAKLPSGSWMDYGGTPPNDFTTLGTGDYKVELTVKDSQGAWSEPFYQTVTVVPDNNAPVARFTVSPNPLPLDVPVAYNDTSWDPDGDPIVAREWQWQKNGGAWVSGQPLDFAALGTGSYNIRLRVQDQPALSQMTPKWSEWYTQSLTVVAGNQKPVARFTVAPNPALTDEPVTYTDTSYDPDGAGIADRVWQVTDTAGRVLGEYHNQLPPRVFANTGWGDGGAGTYRLGLRVRDNSPNGVSPALWSDWTWQTLTVVMPLSGSGEISPNPALSGFRVRVTVWTSGYAEEVRVKFPQDAFFRGDEIVLTPAGPISGKENTWRGAYLTDAKTPDGPYTVMATIRRRSVAPQTVTVPLTLVIRGDIYDQIRVRIRDSR